MIKKNFILYEDEEGLAEWTVFINIENKRFIYH